MRTLLINASPRGNKSSSLKVAEAFLKGIEEEGGIVRRLNLCELDIKPCKGCLCCWKGDSGKCVINDDAKKVQDEILSSDTLVYSFPLYYFAMPALLCNFFDRSVCMAHSYRGSHGNERGGFLHDWRYDELNKINRVFISTCGYETVDENYDSVRRRLDLMYGENNHTDIFVPQGGVLAEKTLKEIVDKYLLKFTEAGREFALNSSLSCETKELLKKPLLRHNTFVRALNMTWDTSLGPYGGKQ